MSIRRVGFFILILTLVVSGMVMAHAGKVHIMGTVTKLADRFINVKTTNGQMKTIAINEKTTFQRGKEMVSRGDLKVNERVVVHATPGKDGILTADTIQLSVKRAKAVSSAKPALSASPQKKSAPAHSH